jgi:hypothetical protein
MKIVILAKSNKRMFNNSYGKCVAGMSADGKWIRLVSDENGDSLPDNDCRHFECLDVIDVDVTEVPLEYQPENMMVERFNGKTGRLSIEQIIDKFGADDDTYCFVNNRPFLYEREMQNVKGSLMLVEVQNLHILGVPKNDRKSYKASFDYNEIHYEDISVTVPQYLKDCSYPNAYIVISIPPDDGGYAGFYKFIAAVYPIND